MIRLHCDRCGRFVQAVGEVKDPSILKRETVCAPCQKTEDKLSKIAEQLKGKWLNAIDLIVQEAKQEVKEELAKIKAAYGKEDH